MARKRPPPRPDIDGLTILEYILSLRPALPYTAEAKRLDDEGRCRLMSNGEVRRHLENGAVLLNGEKAGPDEALDFPVWSLVFFPKSEIKRTTLV